MECSACGRQSDGKFCPDCGSPLAGAACRSCGAALGAGSRFCNQCGTATSAAGGALARAPAAAPSSTPWLVAGGVLVVLILVMVVPMFMGQDSGPAAPAAPLASGAGGMPALSGDMRENADRLFNRIMEAREMGDAGQAAQFYPMAVQAYEAAEPLDADGLYHLSLIQNVAGDQEAARATAQRILDMAPNHLLGLGAAADAALNAGDQDAARSYYDRFLEVYDTERTNQYPEYLDHARILPSYEQQARLVTGN